MAYTVRKVEVWAGDLVNKPGMLARVLEALAAAGAQLEFMVARRVSENTGRVFVAPVKGRKQKDAATDVGLSPAGTMHALRVEGPDRVGLGADITRAVAAAGVNVRGSSAATIGRKNVFYLAFRTAEEALTATRSIRRALARKR